MTPKHTCRYPKPLHEHGMELWQSYAWFNLPCYHLPGTSPTLRAQEWGIVWSSSVPGGRGRGKWKYVLFDFAKYMLFLAQYARWLRTLRLRIFKGKCWNLLESGWRRITYQYLSLNLKVCFKTSNECVYDACTNGFFLQINESLALIIRQLKYSWLPITRTLANSNLALTRTNVDFPWISILHLL